MVSDNDVMAAGLIGLDAALLLVDNPGVNDAPTFVVTDATGSPGRLLQPLGGGDDGANAMVVQPDGRILLAGFGAGPEGTDLGVMRLNADGSLDTAFGTGGRVLTALGAGFDAVYAMALQPDGDIVLFCSSDGVADSDLAVLRLTADGSLDASFGNAGIVQLDGGGADFAGGVAIQSDGAIVLAGTRWNGSDNDIVLRRLVSDGGVDTDFGAGGQVSIDYGRGDDNAAAVALQNDGRIVVVGSTFNGSNFDVAVARLNGDGSLDNGFGSGGLRQLVVGSGDEVATAVAVQPDGRILIAGSTETASGYDMLLLRLNADGSLDGSFNGSGRLVVPVGSADDFAYAMVLQPDGQIVLAGQSSRADGSLDFAVVQVNANGTLDNGFLTGGKALVAVGGGDDSAYAVALQSDGRLLLAGTATGATDTDVALLRLNADGSVDSSFDPASIPTVGGSVTFEENGVAVRLDSTVAVRDPDLLALNSGVGNYAGSSLQLQRQGGADVLDEFGAEGGLTFAAGGALLDGVQIGSVVQQGGRLTLLFGALATQARVDEALSSLTYRYLGDAPPAGVTIAWTFSDGNGGGSQGSGGELSMLATSQVQILAGNDAPVLVSQPGPTFIDDGVTLFSLALDEHFRDPDDTPLSAITLTADRGLPTWLSYDAATHVLSGIAPVGTTGSWSLVATARDADGASVASNFTLQLRDQRLLGGDGADTLTGASGQDVLDGGAGSDALDGGAGNDTLVGSAGDDTLNGGVGEDSLTGGAGDDLYGVDSASDVIAEAIGEGHDRVWASVDYVLGMGISIESLTLKGTATALTGNELANALFGADLADTLMGLDGNDTLDGGAGSDRLVGGAGDDTYTIDNAGDVVEEAVGEGTDTVVSSLSHRLGSDLENLTLYAGAGSISGTGNELDNVLTGNEGDNTLDGGAGSDRLVGGSGDDSYTIDNAGDVVEEAVGEGTDTVISSLSHTLGMNLENLTLHAGAGSISGTGNELDNVLTGNEGDNTLDGGAGSDRLVGGSGDDSYTIDNAGDVVEEAVGEGTDTVVSSLSHTLGTNLENLTLYAGAGAISGSGNALDNAITGNEGNNAIDGAAGNDTLLGGAGNDSLAGGAGNDWMAGGLGDDYYYVDSAADVLSEAAGEGFDRVFTTVNYTVTAGAAVENVFVMGAANVLVGNELANNLFGGALADSLSGMAGNDKLDSGAGNDLLDGGIGNDTLLGGAGNDSLTGGAGNDWMAGGLGDDYYYVDSAADVLSEAAGEGFDRVFTTVNYTVTAGAAVENVFVMGAANVLVGNELANNLFGGALADSLSGMAGNDKLDSGAGNDLLDGGIGNDTLLGGAGNDSLAGGAGNDWMAGGLGDDYYYVDSAADVLSEAAGEGFDRVFTTVNYTVTAGAAVENVFVMGAASALVGNELANNLFGGALADSLSGMAGNDKLDSGAGNDLLDGGIGNDTLLGGAGNDSLAGGAGNDWMAGGLGDDYYYVDSAADVLSEAAGEGFDRVFTTVNYTVTAGAAVENVFVMGAASALVGNELANNLFGGALADSLSGMAGNDKLDSGAGNDLLAGGVGTDTLIGGAGNDTFIFDTLLNASTNVDVISDFAAGDLIAVDNDIFTALGAAGALSAGQFYSGAGATGASVAGQTAGVYYNTSTGSLYYDADGFGGSAAVQFASLATKPVLTAASFSIGE
ncbi:putative Ig domain-containing protein [Sphaerotilus microaerophilus]|nr:putative Ig domain-containing protein [Sphaerotilus sp. FB-5]